MTTKDEVREIYEQWKKEPGHTNFPDIDILVARLSDHFDTLLAKKMEEIKKSYEEISDLDSNAELNRKEGFNQGIASALSILS